MVIGRTLGMALLPRIEARQGRQPMRLGTDEVMFVNLIFVLQKRRPWNEAVNYRQVFKFL